MAKSALPERNRNNAIQRLCRKQEYFLNFESVEDWVSNETNEVIEKEGEYFSHIKNYIINNYKLQDIYLPSSAIDDIIFYCLQNSTIDNFLTDIINLIDKNNLTKKSVVIFPVHNFGFQYLGVGNLFGRSQASLKYENFQINTQTNSFDKSVNKIKEYLGEINFSKVKSLDYSLFKHYYVSRNLKWFDRNPVMYFDFKFTQFERFDNVAFILEKMSFITNKLYFISVLRSSNIDEGRMFSSKNSNNWQTLDINHFLTITSNGKKGNINCIPIHYKYSLLYDEMHLNIDLLEKKTRNSKWEKEAINCIDKLYYGYRDFLITKDRQYRIFYKVANSLKYFRRSVKSINLEDRAININIAFETLLLDNEGQKKEKILERTWKALKGKITKKKNIKNLSLIIDERNSIIHSGQSSDLNIDYDDVFKVFCRLVLVLSLDIERIDSAQDNCMSLYFATL